MKALPKELAGGGRLCCCGKAEEHPAELAAAVQQGSLERRGRAEQGAAGRSVQQLSALVDGSKA